MFDDPDRFIRAQMDRTEILGRIMTYCKGIDRLDRELLLSVYHPDALDDHGIFVGPASQYIDWIIDFHRTHQQRTMHAITTHFCELDGDVAHTETYYTYRALNRQAPFYNTATGRYLDRFEKREGQWKIAHRICVTDILDEHLDAEGNLGDGNHPATSRSREDTSFRRPYAVDPARFTV